MVRIRRRLLFAQVAAVGALALVAAGCGSSSPPPGTTTGANVAGGTATIALRPGVTLSYIFPFAAIANSSEYNSQSFQYLMYRPLYMFGNNGNSELVNYPLSPANAPSYSGNTVTFTMKGWKWSNGETVSGKDVVFWLNMMMAQKANFYGYSPGLLPDNLLSYQASGNQVTMKLNKAYSSVWFTYNQLAELTPMPMAWDVTKLGAAPGSGGCTTDTAADKWAKCTAVWTFLANQAKAAASYASSPIWSVVDGPWKLSTYSSAGQVTMVPNAKYSGTPKATLSAIKFVPFTDDTTEYTALKTGQLDYGYIPVQDLPQKPASQPLPSTNPLGSAYNLLPNYTFSIRYAQPNFNNPTFGAVFKQLYVRQALQDLVDQNGIVTALYRGYAYPTPGPVPPLPASQWVSASEQANAGLGPYSFNINKAKQLFTSHGWQEVGGVMTCEVPAQCGPGISKGQQMKFSIYYSTGVAAFGQEAATMKSDASQIGVDISLVGQSFNTIIGESTPCAPGPKCNWDVLMYGGWAFNGPGYEPTGEPLFQTGAASNSGSYSNPAEDNLVSQTHLSNSLQVFHQYEDYTAQQLPYLWLPNDYIVQAVSSKLKNVTVNPLFTFLPEYWNFTK